MNDPTDFHTVHDNAGIPIRATYYLHTSSGTTELIYKARGGSIGAPNEQNADYNQGMDILLARMAACNIVLTDALLDTKVTQQLNLTPEQRRLVTTFPFPIKLAAVADLRRLRVELCTAQRAIGRQPGARGIGSNTKRIRLIFGGTLFDANMLAATLVPGASVSDVEDELSIAPVFALKGSSNQGHGLTAAQRRAIELRAMVVARSFLEAEWDSITDVSGTESFDLLCEAESAKLYVEVKGTTGAGESVIVTRNEVAHTRLHFPHTALLVVSGIALADDDGLPLASGGSLVVIRPWEIDSARLDAIAYDYCVPSN